MGEPRLDVLVFVEDPGAANMIIGIDEALLSRGLVARTFAPTRLQAYLDARGQDHVCVAETAGILDRHQPRTILVGTSEDPDTAALELIAEGRRRGVTTAAVIDGPANAEHRFRGRSGDPLAFAPDRLAVPDEATARAYLRLGFPEDRITVCGHPLHDRVLAARSALEQEGRGQVRRRIYPDAPKGGVIILFLAELSDGLNPSQFLRGPEYTLAGRGGSDRRTDIVLEEVLDALQPVRDGVQFVLRLHPKNTSAEFARYLPETDLVSTGGPAWDAVFAADLVVGMTTVLLLEAALLGRPTLSILPRPCESAWLDAIERGLIRSVATRAELRRLLPQAVADPNILAAAPAQSLVRPGAKERLAAWIAGIVGG